MKILNTLLFVFVLLYATHPLQAQELKTKADSISYSVGLLLAQKMAQQGLKDVDAAMAAEGIKAALKGGDAQIELMEANKLVMAHVNELKEKSKVENEMAGKKFLEDNAKREGIKVTDSGLQYLVVQEGQGISPSSTDKVTVHYRGTLIDGTEFDSSYSRGEPTSFPLNRVIKGWTEGLQLMKPGAKYRFFIPSDLAYGANGAGALIGPNSTLIFDVELLQVN